MRHGITRLVIGAILAAVSVYGLIAGKGSNMIAAAVLGIAYLASGIMIVKREKENKGSGKEN